MLSGGLRGCLAGVGAAVVVGVIVFVSAVAFDVGVGGVGGAARVWTQSSLAGEIVPGVAGLGVAGGVGAGVASGAGSGGNLGESGGDKAMDAVSWASFRGVVGSEEGGVAVSGSGGGSGGGLSVDGGVM